jgi:hypothetical protein
MTDETRFAEAIHKLTNEHMVQAPAAGKTHYERHAALITQLRKAAVPGTTNDGGSGKQDPRERIPFDADAVTKYDNLTGQIGSWFLEVMSVRPPRRMAPEAQLSRVARVFTNGIRAGRVNDGQVTVIANRWDRWVTTIEDKLAGLTSLEVTAPCPVCSFEWIIDKDGQQVRALVATYKDDLRGGLSESFARCKLCGEVWHGDGALRNLRILIDEREAQSDTPVVNQS